VSLEEANELRQREDRIKQCLPSVFEVGEQLAVIRDKKLYRAGYPTFETYCSEKWRLRKTRIYQLLQASETFQEVEKSTIVEVLPSNERQTRQLQRVPRKQRAKVWEAAVKSIAEGEEVPGEHVEGVVEFQFGKYLKKSVRPLTRPLQ
jgi:hypothetical protein